MRAVALLSDGRVVSGSCDNTLKVWDSVSGQCLQTLSGHTDVSDVFVCLSIFMCIFVYVCECCLNGCEAELVFSTLWTSVRHGNRCMMEMNDGPVSLSM